MKVFKLSGYYFGHQHYKQVLRFFEAVKVLMAIKPDEEVKVQRSK